MSKLSILEQLKARTQASAQAAIVETPPVGEVAKSSSASACISDTPPPLNEPAPVRGQSMKEQVYAFVAGTKLVGLSDIPVVGASNVEIAAAFPEQNSNTLRYLVWGLRKEGRLVDSGIRRVFGAGKVPQVVWVVAARSTGDE